MYTDLGKHHFFIGKSAMDHGFHGFGNQGRRPRAHREDFGGLRAGRGR